MLGNEAHLLEYHFLQSKICRTRMLVVFSLPAIVLFGSPHELLGSS
jgi:hypothetical protein